MFAVVGGWVLEGLTVAGRCMYLLVAMIGQLPRLWRVRRQLMRQMDFSGFGSIGVLCLITTLTGMIMVMAMAPTMVKYGGIQYLGFMLGGAFCRELGPLWAAVIVLARVGSAMAAEIGTMNVNEEVQALRVMDINPVRYLVLPRILGLMLVMPLLTAIGDVVGLYGSAVVAQLAFNYSVADFFESMRANLDGSFFLGGIAKSIVFGLTIGLIACDQGLHTEGGAEGVGRSTTTTVRLSVIYVLILDLIIPMPDL